MGRISEMHRAAEAFAQAISPAINLSHHFSNRRAEHDRIAVAAVARHCQVLFATGSERADNRGFRAVSKMRVSANHAGMLDECSFHSFFKLANPHHLRVDPDEPVFSEVPCRVHRSLLQTLSPGVISFG